MPSDITTGLIRMTDSEFHTLATFVKQNYGVNLEKKRVLIEGRMTNMLRERGFSTFGQYLDFLFQDTTGQECTNMLNKLTTNYSFFMREPEHFIYLKTVVLPQLVKAHARDHDLRIWSAGCSAGQEPYTIAMVMDEFFGTEKKNWDTTILASDISGNALERAKKAIYSEEEIRDVPPLWKNKYFIPLSGSSYQICDEIRSQVAFRTINLMDPFQFRKELDVIFCRNVMIYYDKETKHKLIQKFYEKTAEGGYLLIGHSESLEKGTCGYRYVKPAIYQRGGMTR